MNISAWLSVTIIWLGTASKMSGIGADTMSLSKLYFGHELLIKQLLSLT